LDEGLIYKSLNPCTLLVPKISTIRHQIPKIGDMMNVLSGATLFCKITHAPNIFKIRVDNDSLGRFVLIFSFNTNLGLAYLLLGIINMKMQKKICFVALLSLIFK